MKANVSRGNRTNWLHSSSGCLSFPHKVHIDDPPPQLRQPSASHKSCQNPVAGRRNRQWEGSTNWTFDTGCKSRRPFCDCSGLQPAKPELEIQPGAVTLCLHISPEWDTYYKDLPVAQQIRMCY